MQPATGIKTWQWVVTAIVIIVLIIIGVMVFGGSSTTPADDTADVTADATTGANRIVVSDQFPGNVVYLSSVQLAKGGWVVIHKDNKGQPGDIIGQTWFDAGVNPGKVTLSQSMVDGSVYYAMIHSDNGDKKFDAKVDMPLSDANGNVIMKIFRASATANADIKG